MPHVFEGLRRLEYRGYDSAGCAWITAEKPLLETCKTVGELAQLESAVNETTLPTSRICIGHTRWATHGVPSTKNAHPHADCSGTIAVVHNGIVENDDATRRFLGDTHRYLSETDTELIAHLLEKNLSEEPTLLKALVKTVNLLNGAYAFLAMSSLFPSTIIAIRKRSPLCLGISTNELFLASDPFAFAGKAANVVFFPEETIAIITTNKYQLYDFKGTPLSITSEPLLLSMEAFEKKGHEHYMLKEILEQKISITNSIETIIKTAHTSLCSLSIPLNTITDVHIIACGTSYHAAQVGKIYFEGIAAIKTTVSVSSEFRYNALLDNGTTLYLLISQSGETADTLEALRLVKGKGLPTIVLSNIGSSTMVREGINAILTHAGREVSVASTKAFSAQIAALYITAHLLASLKNNCELSIQKQIDSLIQATAVLSNSLDVYQAMLTEDIARIYSRHPNIIFLGRHLTYPLALEATLKFKELTYQFACAEASGELKHGPLALVTSGIPVVIIAPIDDILYHKLLINAQEIKARHGIIIAILHSHQIELQQLADHFFVVGQLRDQLLAPIAMIGILQLFVYGIAKKLDRSIDKPRNLAKSVTVE